MKRDALLDCLDTARDCYRHAWAHTSVDIAIQVLALLHLHCSICACRMRMMRLEAVNGCGQDSRPYYLRSPAWPEARRGALTLWLGA